MGVSLAPPILTSNIFLAQLCFVVLAFLSLVTNSISSLAHSLTRVLGLILVFIIIRDYSFPHTKHMLPLFLHLLILFLFPSYASASASSCHPSSFYSSIPELANGKPTTRAGWESVLDQLHTLLESSHVTVPYTSTNTDVVSVIECNRVQYGTVWYSRGEYSTVL